MKSIKIIANGGNQIVDFPPFAVRLLEMDLSKIVLIHIKSTSYIYFNVFRELDENALWSDFETGMRKNAQSVLSSYIIRFIVYTLT